MFAFPSAIWRIFISLFCIGFWLGFVAVNSIKSQPLGWQALDQGLRGWPTAACFWNDTLYVATLPSEFEGLLCRWTGARWDTVARMRTAQHMLINRLLVFRGELIIAGYFEHINQLPDTKSIVAWNGKQFRGLGLGLKYALMPNITDAVVWNDRLYICGPFSTVGDLPAAPRLAVWDGQRWQALFSRVVGLYDRLTARSNELWVVGQVDSVDGRPAANLARFDGTTWTFIDEQAMAPVRSHRLDYCTSWQGDPVCQGRFTLSDSAHWSGWGRWRSARWELLPSRTKALPIVAYGSCLLNDTLQVAYGYDSRGRDAVEQYNTIILNTYWAGNSSYTLPTRLDGPINWMLARGDTLYAGGSFKGAYTDGIYRRIPGGVAYWLVAQPLKRKSLSRQDVFVVYHAGRSLLQKPDELAFRLECYNGTGQLVSQAYVPAGQQQFLLPDELPAGVYYLRLIESQNVYSLRWLKLN